MYLGVKTVKPLEDYKLLLTFENNEAREFDMKGYLNKGVFMALQDKQVFQQVRVSFDTIEWPNGADFDPELLYDESQAIT